MWSRALLVLFVVACDHRPAPKQDTPKAAPVTSDGGVAFAPPGEDVCLQIGAKIAEIIISATTDPTQKAAYEQERTKLVKRFSDNCQREQWPAASRACFLAAKTPGDVELCGRDLPRVPPPAPAAGSGAAGSGAAGSGAGSAGGSGATGSGAGSAAGSGAGAGSGVR